MKSREEQLTWAKQRALICVGVGRFADAVAGLRADLDKGVMSSEQPAPQGARYFHDSPPPALPYAATDRLQARHRRPTEPRAKLAGCDWSS
jgi:hypothetical protein